MGKPRLGDVIGYRKDGREIRLIGGGAEDEGHPNEDQGGDAENEDDSLLGGDEGEDGDDPDGGDGGDQPEVDEALVNAVTARMSTALEDAAQRIADRMVNAMLKDQRKPKDQKEPKVPTQTAGDVRGARLATREYLGDSIQFLDATERARANDLAALMLSAKAAEGFEDEDAVGREIAEKVAQQIKSDRAYYEKKTKAALQARGALKDKEPQPGTGGSGGNKKTPGSEWGEGADVAKAMFGEPAAAN